MRQCSFETKQRI